MGNSSSKHTWQKLEDSPFRNKHCGKSPIIIGDQFIILSPELTNKLYAFNTKSNMWSEHKFTEHKNIWFQSLCPSNKDKNIYLYDGHNANILLIIDTKTKKVIKTINKIKKTGIWPSILSDPDNNNILHIIGGSSNNSHLTININTEEILKLHEFQEVDALSGGAIVYVPNKQVAFLFHGDIPVYAYNFKTREWNNTKIKFPKHRCKSFGYVLTHDEKYILMFGGGYRDGDAWTFNDNIFIFDVNKISFSTSNIKSPKFNNMNAAITGGGDIHLFYKENHWVKNISELFPEYNLYGYSAVLVNKKNRENKESKQDMEELVSKYMDLDGYAKRYNKYKGEFIYKRACAKQFEDGSCEALSQIHNIGIVMAQYGCLIHESTGFIFCRCSLSTNVFYVLTHGDAVIKWNEGNKKFEQSRTVSFHLMKNIDDFGNGLPSDEIARFSANNWKVHPKYLKHKLPEYNIAIIKIKDFEDKINNMETLKLCESIKKYNNWNKANVFGYAGIWEHELFGMKGDIDCSDGKTISFKNIISRGKGGPIFCYEEKNYEDIDIKVDEEYSKMREILNMGLDMDSAAMVDTEKISNFEEFYNDMFLKKRYKPSEKDQRIFNKEDEDYKDIFGSLNQQVMGISVGENGLLLTNELLKWIKSNVE